METGTAGLVVTVGGSARAERVSSSCCCWPDSGQKSELPAAMASCLLECLCEAELEQYYPHFVAIGLHKIEELAKITMKDYSRLGVSNMEDRKRLFQLIRIIQSVSDEESEARTPFQPGCVYLQPQNNRSATRRQLQFDAYDQACSPFSIKRLAEAYEKVPRPDQLHNHVISTGQTEEVSSSSAEVSSRALRGAAAGSPDGEGPAVHRVMHVSGYNYGVPQSGMRPIGAEKEGPWTDSDRIRVCVRKRPLGLREERRGEVNVVTVEGRETVHVYERKEAVNLKEYILQHVFYFDEVFGENLTNQDVYIKTAQPLIQHVFNRGNATCFAYGQTGAGKTYTMIGTQKNPGLYALAAKDVFKQLEAAQPAKELSVWISFYEIYCGQLYDLLNGRKRLYAREDGKHVVQVVGLRDVQVRNVDFLLEMIARGSRERSTGASGVNSDSSRSHAIIQIQIKDGGNRKLGRMSFIDLAGSERAADARESDKQTKMEGAEINQSLLALKECIRALDQEQAHTPFRQSKLTQVLKDSFVGNSKTCMIANVSPSHIATEHTLNTLRYADRVKELKKGMKSTSACTNRGRNSSCLSPKRVQNSPSVLGEKISPKKVKLGAQHSSTSHSAKTHKSYPSIFHPTNVPFSSTPKPCSRLSTARASSNQAWLVHTTPVKVLVRPGNSGTKKSDTQEKSPVQRTAQDSKSDVDTEFKVNLNHHRFMGQRVQPVQPVQKQIITRTAVPFVEQNSKSVNSSDNVSQRTNSKFPEQKEREEHLKHYHQQFQHPPIFHQKLHYQPLEKLLDRYKPREVKVGHINTSGSHHEGLPPEDPDDSDFSEDSFSYASGHKKGNKEEMVRERLSFFLHQNVPGTEIRKSTERAQDLHFNCTESQEQNQQSDCECSATCGYSELKREIGQQNLWSSEEYSTSARDSSSISDAPEKPYSSQEELTDHQKKKEPSKNNPQKDSCMNLNATQEIRDKAPPLISPQSTEVKTSRENLVQAANTSSDSSSLMAPLTVSLLKDNWSMESSEDHQLYGFSNPISASKNESFDKSLSVEASVDAQAIEKHLSALVKKMLRYSESLQSQNSPQQEKDWSLETSSESKPSTSLPSFVVHQGSCEKKSIKSAKTAAFLSSRQVECNTNDSSMDFVLPRSSDQISQFYEADAEESAMNYQSYQTFPEVFSDKKSEGSAKETNQREVSSLSPSSFCKTNSGIQSCCMKPSSESHDQGEESNVEDAGLKSSGESLSLHIKNTELDQLKNKLRKCILAYRGFKDDELNYRIEKSPKNKTPTSGPSTPPHVNSQCVRDFDKAQHLLLQAHCNQLKEVAALCCQEEALLHHISNAEFPEYVKKLDDILVLKSKHIESLRSHLQAFLELPSAELSSLSSGLERAAQEERLYRS
ncbi:kinesin-like protein KIF24 [Hyperolius riggenbachi]|uniref:kinesin-like protein KIF24 n=1 Tax=Hyperolius riggenbachi TaxID=752182 RepID=UPI0035A2C6A4